MLNSSDELRHVLAGPDRSEKPGGVGLLDLFSNCPGNAVDVERKTREVMRIVLESSQDGWPSSRKWQSTLPEWFVVSCAIERNEQQEEEWLKWWRSLDKQGKEREAKQGKWTLSNWLYWLEPTQRSWWWWSSEVTSSDRAVIKVQIDEWPTATGSLGWLLRVAGARDVFQEE
jgi:nitroimidazol reductase NimA-like FMN-containing flavoprotein (pyridoxamine 5'-phosphate oxidase superfamily)